jgi:FHA domain
VTTQWLTARLLAPSLGVAVSSYVEVWSRSGRQLRALDLERLTVGTLESNDVVVDADGVSRVHAVFERFGDTWCVRDLGSRNGTFVNGRRITGERTLHSGDEIVLGRLRLLFHGPSGGKETAAILEAPQLTPRERDVLLALCRPLLTGDAFTEPASIRAIAAELVVSEAAVKQHLSRLYDKFDVGAQSERRRLQLANAAVARGAVRLGDLRRPA